MWDLNDALDASGAGRILEYAKGINDAGRIAAFGNFNGQQRAALLTPSGNGGSGGKDEGKDDGKDRGEDRH
jgi:hypothetical protein